MATRKMRKFAEGGFTRDQEEWLGGADRTDPYILARMRDAHPDNVYKDNAPYKSDDQGASSGMESKKSEPAEQPVTKSIVKTKVSVTKPKSTWEGDDKIPAMPDTPKKAKSSWEDDSKISAMPDAPRKKETPAEFKDRMESRVKEQGIERVEPENYVPGVGLLKGAIKNVISKATKDKLKTYSAEELAKMTPKMIGKENLKLGREPLKIGREPLKLGMKKGGVVKSKAVSVKSSSASKRADGCAIRGKTRA